MTIRTQHIELFGIQNNRQRTEQEAADRLSNLELGHHGQCTASGLQYYAIGRTDGSASGDMPLRKPCRNLGNHLACGFDHREQTLPHGPVHLDFEGERRNRLPTSVANQHAGARLSGTKSAVAVNGSHQARSQLLCTVANFAGVLIYLCTHRNKVSLTGHHRQIHTAGRQNEDFVIQAGIGVHNADRVSQPTDCMYIVDDVALGRLQCDVASCTTVANASCKQDVAGLGRHRYRTAGGEDICI